MRASKPDSVRPTVKAWGSWVPCAWPHDGLQHDKGRERLAQQYADAGLKMLKEHATHAPDPGNPEGPAAMASRLG